MAHIVCPLVSAVDRARLEAITADRNRAQKHVARARIILAAAERLSVAEIARRAGASRPAVWRWQRRFAEAGVEGLLHDATRKPGKAPLGDALVHRVVGLTCTEPPGEATHWTGRAMAKTAGISLRSVQRIWTTHDLQPRRIRTFKRSRDPELSAKLEDIVGLYVAPPKHAIVLSVDEKSQIQALDRTQPGLPLKPGRAGTMTHDYKRHGTTTLFAALNVLEGTVIGRCMQRHRHQEFIRFLNAVERVVPAGKVIHAILDNYGAHKHPNVLKWLARHPRWTFHFTPTSGSWLNAVETFFSALTRRRLKRGSFHSIVDLQAAITRYVDQHNDDPQPFTWTKSSDQILAKVNRLNASLHCLKPADDKSTEQMDATVAQDRPPIGPPRKACAPQDSGMRSRARGHGRQVLPLHLPRPPTADDLIPPSATSSSDCRRSTRFKRRTAGRLAPAIATIFQAALADHGSDNKSRLLTGRQLGRASYSADLMRTESPRTNALGGMRGKSLNAGREK